MYTSCGASCNPRRSHAAAMHCNSACFPAAAVETLVLLIRETSLVRPTRVLTSSHHQLCPFSGKQGRQISQAHAFMFKASGADNPRKHKHSPIIFQTKGTTTSQAPAIIFQANGAHEPRKILTIRSLFFKTIYFRYSAVSASIIPHPEPRRDYHQEQQQRPIQLHAHFFLTKD